MYRTATKSAAFAWLVWALIFGDADAAADRWLRAYAEVTVSADGQIEEYKITSDTPKILREIFRAHLAPMKFTRDELESMPAVPAKAMLTVYYRLSENSNGDFNVLLDDKKLLFKHDAIRIKHKEIRNEDEENTDVVPIVIIQPKYPRGALNLGYAGWVELEFTITEEGLVEDIEVVHASHKRLFRREAIKAIRKWKFKPRTIAGKPVRRGASQTIEFAMQH